MCDVGLEKGAFCTGLTGLPKAKQESRELLNGFICHGIDETKIGIILY